MILLSSFCSQSLLSKQPPVSAGRPVVSVLHVLHLHFSPQCYSTLNHALGGDL